MTNILPLDELAETGLAEEMSEVAKELCKGKRFGWHDVNPLDGTSPAQRISVELGDLMGSIHFFIETHPGVIDFEAMFKARDGRKEKLLRSNDPAYVEAWKERVLSR